MKIPKKIHYCWFGGAKLPDLAVRCIESWKLFCPDYEIIRWDESNSDLENCQFVREAYSAKKWAFVSDYMRLKVVEEHGGIYLDIDVELLKPLDSFLAHQGFMGFEQAKPYCVATGLGFGAVAHHPVIQKLMMNYENTPFIQADGSFDMMPCPKRDTKILVDAGLRQVNQQQCLDGIKVFTTDYFCSVSFTGVECFTENTVSIHHYNASWLHGLALKNASRRRKFVKRFGATLGVTLNAFFWFSDEVSTKGFFITLKNIANRLRRK